MSTLATVPATTAVAFMGKPENVNTSVVVVGAAVVVVLVLLVEVVVVSPG